MAPIVGTVARIEGRYAYVVSPSESRTHLREVQVPRPSVPSALAGLAVGDAVRCEYFSSRSYGYWSIAEILQSE